MGTLGYRTNIKEGDLTFPENDRGICLTQPAANVYNQLLLNIIRPELEKILAQTRTDLDPYDIHLRRFLHLDASLRK